MSMQQLTILAQTTLEEVEWHDVCAIDDVLPGTGAAALIGGEQIAVVRTRDGRLAALSNFDPGSAMRFRDRARYRR